VTQGSQSLALGLTLIAASQLVASNHADEYGLSLFGVRLLRNLRIPFFPSAVAGRQNGRRDDDDQHPADDYAFGCLHVRRPFRV